MMLFASDAAEPAVGLLKNDSTEFPELLDWALSEGESRRCRMEEASLYRSMRARFVMSTFVSFLALSK